MHRYACGILRKLSPLLRHCYGLALAVLWQSLVESQHSICLQAAVEFHGFLWAYLQVCKEEADRMRLGLPLSGEFRKTRQKKYKEKHEQGRIAAAGLCLLRGENGTPEGEEGTVDQQQQQQPDQHGQQQQQHEQQQQEQQPDQHIQEQTDHAAPEMVLPDVALAPAEVVGESSQHLPAVQSEETIVAEN